MKTIILSLAGLIFVFSSACHSGQNNEIVESTKTDTVKYIRQGDSIVKLTFDTLRNALTGAIASKGLKEAISYCNVNAYPITDHFARDGITVRRTSTRYRNPQNRPDSLESVWLEKFSDSIIRSGGTGIFREGNNIHYFKPILLQAMCKNCHGNPTLDILPETLAEIRNRYPDDHATGFRENELRGMWHLVFSEK